MRKVQQIANFNWNRLRIVHEAHGIAFSWCQANVEGPAIKKFCLWTETNGAVLKFLFRNRHERYPRRISSPGYLIQSIEDHSIVVASGSPLALSGENKASPPSQRLFLGRWLYSHFLDRTVMSKIASTSKITEPREPLLWP